MGIGACFDASGGRDPGAPVAAGEFDVYSTHLFFYFFLFWYFLAFLYIYLIPVVGVLRLLQSDIWLSCSRLRRK